MINNKKFDIFFLVDSGIGNALEMLYALEYCIRQGKKTGIYLSKISSSFISYLTESYGNNIIVDDIDNVETTNLIHSFTCQENFEIKFEYYYYVYPDYYSTKNLSETEQYISIVKGLYPSASSAIDVATTLQLLKEDYSELVKKILLNKKVVLYPGCASNAPAKRWPYYLELINQIGPEKIAIIGGNDDLNFSNSYYYPRFISSVFHKKILNEIFFYSLFKRLKLLKPHAHFNGIENLDYAYFNILTWGELTALLRRIEYFIGNDGGITHLAGACGAKGIVIFGPSSVNKNKTYNKKIKPIYTEFSCQPCQFNVGGVPMVKNAIVCPYQIKCMYSLTPENVASEFIIQS
jgi:ADP-heptose:LPS heptosyltransferase